MGTAEADLNQQGRSAIEIGGSGVGFKNEGEGNCADTSAYNSRRAYVNAGGFLNGSVVELVGGDAGWCQWLSRKRPSDIS